MGWTRRDRTVHNLLRTWYLVLTKRTPWWLGRHDYFLSTLHIYLPRYEEHIKRIVKYAKEAIVTTKLRYDNDWTGPKDKGWLAPTLKYKAKYDFIKVRSWPFLLWITNWRSFVKPEVVQKDFHLFSTRRPTRFELKLDELFDSRYLKHLSDQKNLNKFASSDFQKTEI